LILSSSVRKRYHINIFLLLLFGVVLPLALMVSFELLLLVFGVKSNYELKESGLASVNTIQTPITMMISDPILGWRIKPNSKRIVDGIEFANNSHGFRGEEIKQPKPANLYRIICFGDSSTYGVFVPFDQIYSTKLQKKLRKHFKGMNIEVINAGVLGYSTLQILALIDEKLSLLEPDLIIVCAGINDASTMSEEQLEDRKLIPFYGDILPTIKYYGEHSRLISLAGKLLFKGFDPLAPLPLPEKFDEKMTKRRVSVPDYEENLEKIFDKASKLSAKTIFLAFSIPPEYQEAMERVSRKTGAIFVDAESALQSYYRAHKVGGDSPQDRIEYFMRINTYFANLLGEEGMKIRRDRLLFVDNCHPNSLGHSVIADALFKAIIDALLIAK